MLFLYHWYLVFNFVLGCHSGLTVIIGGSLLAKYPHFSEMSGEYITSFVNHGGGNHWNKKKSRASGNGIWNKYEYGIWKDWGMGRWCIGIHIGEASDCGLPFTGSDPNFRCQCVISKFSNANCPELDSSNWEIPINPMFFEDNYITLNAEDVKLSAGGKIQMNTYKTMSIILPYLLSTLELMIY